MVIDAQRQLAYLANPKGGIDAVRLARGDLAWHSDQAARPLAVVNDALLVQVEPSRPANELVLRTLDAVTGRTRRTITHVLPQGMRAMVVGGPEASFLVRALATGTEVTLAWEFVQQPLQGVRPGALDIDRTAEERDAALVQLAAAPAASSGVLQIDLASGRVSDAPSADSTILLRQRVDAPTDVRLSAITGEQFLSSDARHILASERIADDSVWEKYQWTVFERGSGRRIGGLRDYRSHAPFIVVGTSVIYETGPAERRTEAGLVTEPLRIRAVDLTKGTQLWAREVRDLVYRGPLPP